MPAPDLHHDIEVEVLPHGVRWTLPVRRLGMLRLFGVFFVIFGLVFVGFSLTWAGLAVVAALKQQGADLWMGVAFALIGIPFAFVGFVPLGIGLAVMFGRCRVRLDETHLRLTEGVGPLHWTWKRPIEKLSRFVVQTGPAKINDKPVTSGPLADLAFLKAEFTGAKAMMLAIGYPRAVVAALAEQLTDEIARQRPDTLFGRDKPTVEVVTESLNIGGPESPQYDEAGQPAPPPPQPEASNAVLDQRADGLTITLPPLGFRKGSKGLGIFGVIWLAFCAVITGFMAFKGGQDVWIGLLIIPIFWAVGAGMLLGGINMGKRRAIIDVVGDTLLISRQNLFGTKQHEWRRDALKTIVVGPSGMEVNNRPVLCLLVEPAEGKTLKLFSARDDDELRWLAATLRQALSLYNSQG